MQDFNYLLKEQDNLLNVKRDIQIHKDEIDVR